METIAHGIAWLIVISVIVSPIILIFNIFCRIKNEVQGYVVDKRIKDFLAEKRKEAPKFKEQYENTMRLAKEAIEAGNERYLKHLKTKCISFDRHDYKIMNEDYRRGNDKERLYLTKYKLKLFKLYNNSCANCGDDSHGADIDHFVFSKNEGGCFMMETKEGDLVNNAILLCEKCNRSKSDKSFREFFESNKLEEILEKNKEMTSLLNEDNLNDELNNTFNSEEEKVA